MASVVRKITGFHEDEDGNFVATLACGHAQHMRRAPPMTERSWVPTSEERAARIGAEIDCDLCERAEIPRGFAEYRRTAVFDAASVPKALLREHRTKLGVWGKLHVVEGRVDYVLLEPRREVATLEAGGEQVIVTALAHKVALHPGARFYVAFYKESDEESDSEVEKRSDAGKVPRGHR